MPFCSLLRKKTTKCPQGPKSASPSMLSNTTVWVAPAAQSPPERPAFALLTAGILSGLDFLFFNARQTRLPRRNLQQRDAVLLKSGPRPGRTHSTTGSKLPLSLPGTRVFIESMCPALYCVSICGQIHSLPDNQNPCISMSTRFVFQQAASLLFWNLRWTLLVSFRAHCVRCLDSSGFERTHGEGVVAVSTHALLCFPPWRSCVFRTHLLILPVVSISGACSGVCISLSTVAGRIWTSSFCRERFHVGVPSLRSALKITRFFTAGCTWTGHLGGIGDSGRCGVSG